MTRISPESVCRRLVPWLLRRRAPVLWSALAATLISGVFAVRLYSDLRSGLEELLPESAPSVRAVRTLSPRLHSSARLAIALEGENPEALERFSDDLAARLRELPPELVESVEYRSDEQDGFLRTFGALYLPLDELRGLRDQLLARIAAEKKRQNPLLVDLGDDEAPAPAAPAPLDLAEVEASYGRRLHPGTAFRNGYYQTPDGRLLVLHVWPPESSTGIGPNQRLLSTVQAEVERLRPVTYDPKLRIGYSGEVANLVEEQAALVADLASSTVVVLVLVVLALWLYFRRWGAIAALSGALAAGTTITFGIAYPLVGHLNANTAFLGSIVVGNGINVGIMFVARYLERRRAGSAVDQAIPEAWSGTLPSTFVAAFGAGLAYLSLAATSFRGFSQFGVIGALGMALCWVCAYLLLPPLLSVIEARFPIDPHQPAGRTLLRVAGWIEARPGAFLAAAALVLAASGAAIAGYRGDLLESDLARIGARHSLKNGAIYWSQKANQVFQTSRTPVLLRAETPEELERTLAVLDSRRQGLGSSDPVRDVISATRLVPRDQAEKFTLIEEMRSVLTPLVLAHLEPALRHKAELLRDSVTRRLVTFADLPLQLRRALSERDGTVGRVALVFPRKVGRLDLDELDQLKQLVRGSIEEADARVQALNTLLLLSDIDDVIVRDAPRATLLALVLVCALVILVVRDPAASATVLATLLLGLIALVGLAAASRVRMNFLNFVVLPITFGIGVDYAVNIVQRFRQEPRGPGALGRVLQETGSAVAVCSATTVIGYASLMVADSQALAGFGFLAALGEITCLSMALLVLPAWLVRHKATPAAVPGAAV